MSAFGGKADIRKCGGNVSYSEVRRHCLFMTHNGIRTHSRNETALPEAAWRTYQSFFHRGSTVS